MKKISWLWALIGLLFSLPLAANSGAVLEDDLYRRLPSLLSSRDRIALPIRRAGNLLLIQAKVDSLEGNFILDTGAPYLVLNKTYFRNYRENTEEVSAAVNGERESVKIVDVDSLVFPALKYTDIIADATDLSQIENKKGVRILGLLGVNLFLEFEIEIDVRGGVLYLNRLDASGRCSNAQALQHTAKPSFASPIDLSGNLISFHASIREKRLRFCLDTGAEYNVLHNDLPDRVMEGIRIMRSLSLYGSSGSSSEVLAGVIYQMEIEGQILANMQTLLTDLSSFSATHGGRLDGMVGYELLNRGKLCLNFTTKEMRFYGYP